MTNDARVVEIPGVWIDAEEASPDEEGRYFIVYRHKGGRIEKPFVGDIVFDDGLLCWSGLPRDTQVIRWMRVPAWKDEDRGQSVAEYQATSRVDQALAEGVTSNVLRPNPNPSDHPGNEAFAAKAGPAQAAVMTEASGSVGLGPTWEPNNRLVYVFERLQEILPCDDDNRPIEAHARKVVRYVSRLREAASDLISVYNDDGKVTADEIRELNAAVDALPNAKKTADTPPVVQGHSVGLTVGTVIRLPAGRGELRVEHRYQSPSHDVLIGLYRNGERIRDLTLYEEEYVAGAWRAALRAGSAPKIQCPDAEADGFILAMRLLQSDLWKTLDDEEKAAACRFLPKSLAADMHPGVEPKGQIPQTSAKAPAIKGLKHRSPHAGDE